ncbi:hypothetical protein B0T25DRAFT_36812 [Lasiosphaeria hispida]|uniref:Uncharacterized protein n=1 Tax=Lasiosphaeria hispida TaxID=260671 RepID=A0AAJ0HV20_9PEZI|nr:hypothetical protein B0T25DRAFT_36812 [Lasiosphaeria hispida]
MVYCLAACLIPSSFVMHSKLHALPCLLLVSSGVLAVLDISNGRPAMVLPHMQKIDSKHLGNLHVFVDNALVKRRLLCFTKYALLVLAPIQILLAREKSECFPEVVMAFHIAERRIVGL